MTNQTMHQYVITKRPSDLLSRLARWGMKPQDEFYGIRRWRIEAGAIVDEGLWGVGRSLEDARTCIPEGYHCLPRMPDDDPVIVEVWI